MTFVSVSQAHVSQGMPGWGPSRPWVDSKSQTNSFPPAAATRWDAHRDLFFLNLSLFCWISQRATKHRPLNLPAPVCGNMTTDNRKSKEAPAKRLR